MNLPGIGEAENTLANSVALAGVLVGLLCIAHYNLRIYALYNGLWFGAREPSGLRRRLFGGSAVPLLLLGTAGLALLPTLLGFSLAPPIVPGLLLVAGAGLLLLLGFLGEGLRHTPLGVLALLMLFGAALHAVTRPPDWSVGVLAWLLLPFIVALAYVHMVRVALAKPGVPLRSRHLDGVALALMGGWMGWVWLRLLPYFWPPVFGERYLPAWVATLVLLAYPSLLAPFAARDLLATLTCVTLTVEGRTLVAHVRLLGLPILVQRHPVPADARLAMWVYGTAAYRYRGWHPRCLVSRSELFLLVPGDSPRTLGYVEGPLGLLGDEYRPLEGWSHPALSEQGQALATQLEIPFAVEPAYRLTMPFSSVAGPGYG